MIQIEILLHCNGPDFDYKPGQIIKEEDEDKALYLVARDAAKIYEPPPHPPWEDGEVFNPVALSVGSAKKGIEAVEELDVLEEIKKIELGNPKHEGGRQGVLASVESRRKELLGK